MNKKQAKKYLEKKKKPVTEEEIEKVMKECSFCHQIKPCREIVISECPYYYFMRFMLVEHICKECDEYHKGLSEESQEKDRLKKEKEAKEYIKKRDRWLKENSFRRVY